MQTTDVPPVFHSDQYATYCKNNLFCMGSDLLLLLLMFSFALYCGNTIDKVVSTLFSATATLCSCLRCPVMILWPYAGPSSVKNRSSFLEVFSQKNILKIVILVLKNNKFLYEGVAHKGLLKLNTSQVFFVYFFV